MNTIKLFFAAGAIALAATGCQKYDEGPAISLVPRAERIANTWVIAHAEENGEDVTDQYDQYELYLTDDGDAELSADYMVFGTQYTTETNGTWNLVLDDENIQFDFEDDSQDAEYQILRLTQEEFWLRKIGEDLEIQLAEK